MFEPHLASATPLSFHHDQPVESGKSQSVLFVIADCPGHFAEVAHRMARRLLADGVQPMFVVTSRFYPRSKGVALDHVGPVHVLADYLRDGPDGPEVDDVELDYWLTHATFQRTRHYWGRHINPWRSYRKATLFFRQLFARHPQIAAVWSEMPSNATLCIAHSEAERCGIPFLGYQCARIPQHFNVFLDRVGSACMPNAEPPRYVPAADDVPDYMADNASRRSVRSAFRDLRGKVTRAVRGGSEPSLEIGSPAQYQIRAVMRRVGRLVYHRAFVDQSVFSALPEPGERSILFPLQYRPEASTSVQARFFEDDRQTVHNLAFSLPHGTTLYVKEHPTGIGGNSAEFYRELTSYPNVRLLDVNPPLGAELHRFSALVTLTSTAGFEAIQRGIPVLLLGRTFYEDYPLVTRIDGWSALEEELRRIDFEAVPVPNPEPMERYLRICFAGSFDYLQAAVTGADNIDNLVVPIVRTLANVEVD